MNEYKRFGLSESSLRSDMAKDFVHDADKRLCCIDDDAAAGYIFFGSMQLRNEFLFLRFSTPVRWVSRYALIQPPIQCVKIVNFKNKNAVKIGRAHV